MYPNTELDFEAAALEPIGFFLRNQPKNSIFTEPIIIVSFIALQPLNFLLKILLVPIMKKRIPDFWYLVPFVFFTIFYLKSGSFWYAFKLHLFIYGLFGLIFNRVLFCGHRLQ